MANFETAYADLVEQMSAFRLICSRVPDFKVSDRIKHDWFIAADLYNAGDMKLAVEAASGTLKGIRTIFTAFLRNSPSHFEPQIKRREDKDELAFDKDIVDGLREKLELLAQAARAETNGNFDRRIEAYAGMKKALYDADVEQDLRDERADLAEAEAKRLDDLAKAALLKEQRLAREKLETEANKKIAEDQRQKELAKRKELTDKARALFA